MAAFIANFSQGPNGYGIDVEIVDSEIVNFAQARARAEEMLANEARQGRPDMRLRSVRIK
jgi:hypothetical protein